MLERKPGPTRALQLAFGELEVTVSAPAGLLRLLAVTHRRHAAQAVSPRRITRALSVRVGAGDQPPELALPDAHRAIAHEVAHLAQEIALDAVVVERGGRALALAGPAGSGRTTLAVHLLARGWRLIGDGNAFLGPAGRVRANHALMALESAALPHLPRSFRVALERSPWHAGRTDTLRFYGVDPADAYGEGAWSAAARLHAVATLGERVPGAELPPVPARCALPREGAARLADRVEAWFDAHAVG